MDWVQVATIIGTIIGTAWYLHRDILQDIKAQSASTDRLYEMFIDLLKDSKR